MPLGLISCRQGQVLKLGHKARFIQDTVMLGSHFYFTPTSKRYWEADFRIGMNQMLIFLTANVFGDDTHSQICTPWSAKTNHSAEQSTGLCRMQQ